MLKKTITYESYDGIKYTEDFYFNLSRAEMVQLECGMKGGFTKNVEEISKSSDPTQIMPLFEKIIFKSYGKKSPDGKRFIKNQEILDEFVQSEAYSELLMELLSDSDKAAEFIIGLANLNPEEIEEAKKKANVSALPSANS